jgi:methanogenic corrinoid protein MtbC1
VDERLYREAAQAIVDGDGEAVEDVARRGITAGIAAEDMMRQGFAPGFRQVEEQFERGELFLRELAASAAAMAAAGRMTSAARMLGAGAKGRILVGAVHGDLHDIGKAVVIAHLMAAGYGVTDLGRDVAAPTFVAQARELAAM